MKQNKTKARQPNADHSTDLSYLSLTHFIFMSGDYLWPWHMNYELWLIKQFNLCMKTVDEVMQSHQ